MHLTFRKANILTYIYLSLLLAMIYSCSAVKRTSVKNPPPNKPFVFDNKITLKGNIAKDEKIRLTNELNNYWDDSLKVRKIQQFGFFYKIKNPAVFDSANINRSISFMNAYLNSQGYYYATFTDSVRIDSINNQLRATISMTANIGKNITIDSFKNEIEIIHSKQRPKKIVIIGSD